MSHFHCLHGAWHGAWVWRDLADALKQLGHSSTAPDLPGLGELALELHEDINLEAHIAAAVPPSQSVLIAHSYAGVLARAIADRHPGLIDGVLLIEALWPDTGQCAMDQLPEAGRDAMQQQIENLGSGWMIPPPNASQFDLNNEELEAEVDARLTPHPAKTFQEPLGLSGQEPVGTYMIASDRATQPYTATAQRLRDRGWRIEECTGGHALMLTRTEFVSKLSLELVNEGIADATRT